MFCVVLSEGFYWWGIRH